MTTNETFDGIAFDGKDLQGEIFEGCTFTHCTFKGTNLNGAGFYSCTFLHSDLTEAIMNAATDFTGSMLSLGNNLWVLTPQIAAATMNARRATYSANLKSPIRFYGPRLPEFCKNAVFDHTITKTCCGGTKREAPVYACRILNKSPEQTDCAKCKSYELRPVCVHRGDYTGTCSCGARKWRCNLLGIECRAYKREGHPNDIVHGGECTAYKEAE